MKYPRVIQGTACVLAAVCFSSTAYALTSVNSPFGSDAVIVMAAGRWSRFNVHGDTPVDVVSTRVMYIDIQPGSTYYGGCAVMSLPSVLTDDINVNGSSSADIFQPRYPVNCAGFYWQIKSSEGSGPQDWLGGHTQYLRGLGGNDIMESNRQFGMAVFGDDGSDYLTGNWENAYLEGNGGNDALRCRNSLFNTSDRYLVGGAGNDCLESNNGPPGMWRAYLTCGADSDVVSTLNSDSSGQTYDSPNCETFSAVHCTSEPEGVGCGVDAECLSGACDSSNCVPTALLVVGSTPLSASDQKLFDELSGSNFTGSDMSLRLRYRISIKRDVDSVTADANGKSLVLISESVASANVGTKFTSISSPLVTLEPAIQGNLNMTTGIWGTSQGTTTGTQVNVISPATGARGLELACGLSGNTSVVTTSSTLNWGVPGSSATIVAKVVGSSTQATAYVYEKGVPMVSGTAPGKRGFLFSHQSAVPLNTQDGWRMFDAMIRWATR